MKVQRRDLDTPRTERTVFQEQRSREADRTGSVTRREAADTQTDLAAPPLRTCERAENRTGALCSAAALRRRRRCDRRLASCRELSPGVAAVMNARMSRLRRSLSRSVHQLSLSRSNSLNGLIELPTSSYATLVDKFSVSSTWA